MKKINFNESREIQLELLQEIHSYCTENDICYYMAFGTLLGAVRHGGFIPWDDDVDIIMPYKDFLKFSEQYQSDKYTVVSFKDKELGFDFGRLYHNGSVGFHHGYETRGVCLDIYILFGTPEDEAELPNFKKGLRRYRENRIKITRFRNLLLKCHLLPGKGVGFTPLTWYCIRYCNKMAKYKETSKNVAIGGMRFYQPRAPFSDRALYKFEQYEFFGPKDYDECLRAWYGDYMVLPPEKERVPYHGFDCYWK